MAAAEASTGKDFSLKRCPGEITSESMNTEAVTGEEERSVGQLCPTKRKAPTGEKNKEDGNSSEEDEEGHQEGEVISNNEEDGSGDDDDKSITESEFDAFVEEERADYRRFVQEELLPRYPNLVFKNYPLVSKEGDVCDGNANVEAAPESK
jgi:hypothetical protein